MYVLYSTYYVLWELRVLLAPILYPLSSLLALSFSIIHLTNSGDLGGVSFYLTTPLLSRREFNLSLCCLFADKVYVEEGIE